MLGLSAHFPYLADLAEFRRQAEWKFLHYGNQLRQQGSVGGQSLAEEAEQWPCLAEELMAVPVAAVASPFSSRKATLTAPQLCPPVAAPRRRRQ